MENLTNSVTDIKQSDIYDIIYDEPCLISDLVEDYKRLSSKGKMKFLDIILELDF